MIYTYETRSADRFYRTDHPDAHEVLRYTEARTPWSIGVWKTRETAEAVADALALFETEQLR